MTRKRIHQLFLRAAMFFAALLFCAPVAADQVSIQKGDMEITGEALGFDGTYLRLGTDYGEVTLDFRGVTCTGAACPLMENYVPTLRLSGDERLSDVLMPALIQGYARAHGMQAHRRDIDDVQFEYDVVDSASGTPTLRFRFHATTSTQGFVDLLNNDADAVLSVREVSDEEARVAYDAGLGRLRDPRRAQIIALDAIVPVVSPRRQAVKLSMDELAALFAGEVRDWSVLGHAAAAVNLHALGSDPGLLDEFKARVLDPVEKPLSDEITLHDSLFALTSAVAADPGAIALAPYDSYGMARGVMIGGGCGLTSRADLVGLKTEDYPLGRPLFMYMPTRRIAPELVAWRSWLFSADAQTVARRAGFVDRGGQPIPIADQGDRFSHAILQAGPEISLDDLQDMTRRLSPRERLSTTFRFNPGSTRLDAQSRSNMLQLARGIRDGDFDGLRLFLVGFSDGKGPAVANLSLSLARAETVRRELQKLLGGALSPAVSLELDAFGEALPIACDDTAWGRQTNRRVELWVQRAG